uniref:RRM domain-containing protein n=1 Tax=Alexandrium monilatum TaxID=311494 RepID=A0A7S4S892_9DINO
MATRAGPCGLELVSGLPQGASRFEVKSLFEAFGPVDACWVISKEEATVGYMRFRCPSSAKAAATACGRGEVRVAGSPIRGKLWERLEAAQVAELPSPPEPAPSVVFIGATTVKAKDGRRSWSQGHRRQERRRRDRERAVRARRSGSRSSSCYSVRLQTPPQGPPEAAQPPRAAQPLRAALPPQAAPAAAPPSPVSVASTKVPAQAWAAPPQAPAPPAQRAPVRQPAPQPAKLFLEVGNLPQDSQSLEDLLEILSPSLETLPDYDRAKGPAVVSVSTLTPGVCRIELQSPRLVESAVRVVDGIMLLERRLEARAVA